MKLVYTVFDMSQDHSYYKSDIFAICSATIQQRST